MEPSQDIASIVRRMQWEAKNRPAGALRAEPVFVALEQAGVRVASTRQYLAAAVKASYCAGGETAARVAISVCEYASPEAARDGLDFMKQRFASITPHAQRVVHGHTVLTIAQPSDATDLAIVERAVKTFNDL
ncbi:MAG: hypothetical protein H0T79_22390 [Deltaproteobacteria bacterium]|nr:hypothetical protein [Deltaproteobacteria bacterium]